MVNLLNESNNPLVWYVFMEDFNRKEVGVFNVFDHWSFTEACKKAYRKYRKEEQINELEEEIRRWARYFFWSKCEYEIILTGWPPPREDSGFRDKKIDIYDQLIMNWEYFFRYITDHRKEFLRREPKKKD